ncbi:MAG: hypothetical protein AAFN77_07615 [Planctomycetota bacterium]
MNSKPNRYHSRELRPVARVTMMIASIVVAGMSLTPAEASAQVFRRQGLIQIDGPFVPNSIGIGIDQDEFMEIEGSGVVKTDPELESIMEKAERYRKDGNFRVATQLWQAVLERSGDSLFSSDGQTYFSMVRRVEEVISRLPAEGLAVYRVNADAKAKELLAQAGSPNDIAALSNIVRQYFLSAEGDDAAFRLGCIYLDEYDFIGARRLFQKIVNSYPDPSISMADVHARIALCNTFLGDLDSAKTSVNIARENDPQSQPAKLVANTVTRIENGEPLGNWVKSQRDAEVNWHMSLSNVSRRGVGRPVPQAFMDEDLVAIWQYSFDPKDRFVRASDTVGQILLGGDAHDAETISARMTDKETKSIKRWREKFWRPTGQLLLSGDQVYFKSGADLTSWRRGAIEEILAGDIDSVEATIGSFISWRSVQRNSFVVDTATRTQQSILNDYGNFERLNRSDPDTPQPYLASDIQIFGDTIHAEMSIHDDVLYSIEGPAFDDRYSVVPKRITSVWNQPYRRSRTNQLVAYDAKSGMVQWRLPRVSDQKDKKEGFDEASESDWIEDDVGFMGAPIGFGNSLLIPVNRGGSIWIYSLDVGQRGKTNWKSFLCDEPDAGSEAWSSIQLSIDGSDLFVNCGLGVTFTLDPATGTIRLAKRYNRMGQLDPFYQRSNWSVKRAKFDGWSSDVVIPYGRQAICFSSDTNTIEALDRNDGSVIWRSDMNPIGYRIDYLLGIYEDTLYAAGKETIVAFDLKGEGRMAWGADQLFDGKYSLGRGWLTSSGIYMPVQDKIMQFDLNSENGKPKLISKVHVNLGGAPVGNLFSDGKRFWVHNGNRLYVLGTQSESDTINAAVKKIKQETSIE